MPPPIPPSALDPPQAGKEGSINGRRLRIRDAMKESLVSCNADIWQQTYTPYASAWPKGSLKSIIRSLKSAGLLGKKGWIPLNRAVSQNQSEDLVFAHLRKIVSCIAQSAIDYSPALKNRRNFIGAAKPHETTKSEVPGWASRLDWRTVRCRPSEVAQSSPGIPDVGKQPTQKPRRSNRSTDHREVNDELECSHVSKETSDIATIAKFKLKSGAQDKADLVGAATELLYNDPCRRFVPAFTVEEDNLRFWMFSRSHIVVSESVSFHQDHELFIRFLLYSIFGSLEDLGFDTTVQRVPRKTSDGKIAYDYQYAIQDESGVKSVYQTVGDPVSEIAAYRIVSRATRVWRVRQVDLDENGNPKQDAKGNAVLLSETRALKDVWLYDDALLETEIQQDIFSKLGGLAEEARPYFLDILHCDVVKCAGNQPDITPVCQEAQRRASEWTSGSRPLTPHSASTHKLRQSTSSPSKHMPPNNPISPRARKHVRTVFKEDCRSVFELDDFRSFIKCILDCVKALGYMRKAGYLHRDVSAGNCLFYRTTGTGKLSDLEYAKPYEDIPVSEQKIGTPDFMAAECAQNNWLIVNPTCPALKRCCFSVHFYHDIESVYWLFFWWLCFRVPCFVIQSRLAPGITKLLEELSGHSQGYFPLGLTSQINRLNIFQHPGSCSDEEEFFTQFYTPFDFLLTPLKLAENLGAACRALHNHTLKEVKDGVWRLPVDAFANTIYEEFEESLQGILQRMGTDSILVQKVDAIAQSDKPLQVHSSSKRRRDTTSDEGKSSQSVQPPPPKKRASGRPRQAPRNPGDSTKAPPPITPKTSAKARRGTGRKGANKK